MVEHIKELSAGTDGEPFGNSELPAQGYIERNKRERTERVSRERPVGAGRRVQTAGTQELPWRVPIQ
jgi:hypothetical protein